MPYKPSLQSKLLGGAVRRPWLGSGDATCSVCGKRILLPRKAGNICPQCQQKKQEKVIMDNVTKNLVKRINRRRYNY